MNGPRILIVDDEPPARDKLRRLLTEHAAPSFLAEARNGVEALQVLAAQDFDAIFLDMHMPELDGLGVAQQITSASSAPNIIFVTAYDQFALQAFEANAIDYLLKPYDEERFLRALAKLNTRLQLSQNERKSAPLIIADRGHIKVVPVADILYVETADNYVLIHTMEAQHIWRQTLSAMLQRLGSDYARCHRRYLVRLDKIAQFSPAQKGDGELILHSGVVLPCSRQYREEVLLALGMS
ncbi:MAG: LytTR family DNA-binding domain-containing protein [Undibacterium sp.]|nr:LytTR family DNA-binding domain-containing protein [Undibacterium sp.]